MFIATAHHWGWDRKVAMSVSSTPEPQEQGKIWGGWSHLGHILLTLCIPATVNIFHFLEIPLFCSTSGPLHLLVPVLEMFSLSFPCLRTLTRTCDTTVKESGENGQPCFIPSLRRKALRFSPLSVTVAMAHHIWPW